VNYEWIFKNFRDFRKMGNQGTKNQYFMFRRRIEGAIKFGNTWAIPEDVQKPKDERVKSGKYVKKPNADEI